MKIKIIEIHLMQNDKCGNITGGNFLDQSGQVVRDRSRGIFMGQARGPPA